MHLLSPTVPVSRPVSCHYMEKMRFSDMYPEIPEEEQNEATENLDRYLLLAWEIYREMQSPDQEL